MNNKQDPHKMGRRDFIRAGAILAGSVALGWKSTADASASALASAPVTKIGLWTGAKIAAPHGAATTTAALISQTAHIRIHDHFVPAGRTSSAVRSIVAHFPVEQGNSSISVPYYAWSASHPATRTAVFSMHVQAGHGLRFSVEPAGKARADESISIPAFKAAGHDSINSGTYVVATGQADWNGCQLIEDNGRRKLVRTSLAGNRDVDFEYVLMTVSRA